MKKLLSIILVAAMIASVMTVSFAVKADGAVQISNADELVAFLTNTENANKDAVLTADIDLSAKSGTNTWKPMVNYSGTFDGAGFTVSGLSFTRNVANNAADMINEGDCQDPTDVDLNCMGKYSYGLFFINLSGSVKNLNIKDVSLTFNANFNKNYRIDVSAFAGYANGASFDNVDMENVDVKTNNTINENQGHLGYGALYVARAAGDISFKNCESDAACSVNTSAAGRMSAAQMLGCYEGSDSLTFTDCTSGAVVTVMAKDAAESGGYMWNKAGAKYSDGVAGGLYKFSYLDLDDTIVANKDANAPAAESINVNGDIDDAWKGAEIHTLTVDASGDSKGNPDTRKDSSKVKFRVMHSGDKVYMLFEIYDKDGDWRFGDGTNWKNDSLFICVSENPRPSFEANGGIEQCKIPSSEYGEKIYVFNVYPDATQGKEVKDLFFVRDGKGTNNLAKEIAVKEVDAENRIVELSFELNTVDVKVGKGLYLDVQYNDADDFNNKEEGSEINGDNPRSIVWNWSTDLANGLSAGNAGSNWGRINFVDDPTINHHDGKANGASFYYQASADGSSYRIVGLVEEASLADIEGIKITFSNGTTTKSITVTSAKAYEYIDASFDGATVTYVAEEGSVILGWVITGIDEEGYTPSAVAVINS